MTRTRSVLAAAAMALAAPGLIAGCGDDGGSSDDRDPEEIVDAVFNNDEQVTSGVLDLSANLSAGDQGEFDFSLGGPFQGVEDDPTAIPQLDWTASASGEGGGQTIDFEGGLIVTDDNAFVSYQGTTYEVGTEAFAQFQEQAEAQAGELPEDEDPATSFREGCAQAIEAQGGDPAACDFDLGAWFTNLSNDGTEDLDGEEAVHVSGDVDVDQMLDDLLGLAQSVPNAQQVDPAQLDMAKDAISEASFDLYSGTEDDLLRKVDVNLSIDPSAIEGGELVPVESIDLGLSVGVSEVNEEQSFEAPADAEPIEDLLGQVGGLGGLGGGGLGGGGLGGSGELPDDQQEQLDCIADAAGDPEAVNECLDS